MKRVSAGVSAALREFRDLLSARFRTGRLDAEVSKKLAALQKFREQADYASAFRFAADGARAEVANADEICAAVRRTIAPAAP